MRERWQIYQLTIPTVPAGGAIGVPLTLDSDAPFLMRRIKSRNLGLSGFRVQNAKKAYMSDFLLTDREIPMADDGGSSGYALGTPTQGKPIYPQEVYDANSQIVVDVGNTTGEPLEDVRLIFYGSKLFKDSALAAKDYGAKISPFPFIYPLTDANGQPLGPVSVPLAASATVPAVLRDLQLRIMQDADFVLRYLAADPFTFGVDGGLVAPGSDPFLASQNNYRDLRVIVKDESRKAYMNEPIDINDVFGQGLPFEYGAGTDNTTNGPIFPGLLTPELIIEREHSLYVDLFRYDLTGAVVDLWLRFHGAKLFRS
jgi:hypothetical protein